LNCSAATAGYSLAVTNRSLGPGGGAVISFENGTSSFKYNFNAGYFPPNAAGGPDGLIIRVQNTPMGGPHSGLAVVRRIGGLTSMAFEHVDDSKMLIRCPGINGSAVPPTSTAPCADDPRIVYRAKDDTYYMVYDNNQFGRSTCVATSKTPWLPQSWTFHGPVSPEHPTNAGVALLLRDDVPGSPHYAFIATDNDAGDLYEATSYDLIHWNTTKPVWARGRPACFDHNGLAAGPQVAPCF